MLTQRTRLGLLLALPLVVLTTGIAFAAPAPLPKPDVEPSFKSFRHLGRMSPWGKVLAITPDGKQLVIAGHSTFLFTYDLPTGKVVHQFNTKESIQDAAVSPDGKLLVTAEWRDGVIVRDLRTLKVLATVKGGAKLAASQVRFSADGTRLFVSSWWGSESQLWVYDLVEKTETSWPVVRSRDTSTLLVREGFVGHGRFLFAVERHHKDGMYHRHRVWLTDPDTGKSTSPIDLNKHDVFQFDVRSDGAQAIVMEPGESPRVVDLKTGKTVSTLSGHERWVTAAAFSPNGRLIATASGKHDDSHGRCYTKNYSPADAVPEIIVRHAGTGRVIGKLQDKEKPYDVMQIGFSPNGKYLFAMTREREVLLWGDLPAMPKEIEALPNPLNKQKQKE
jgi:WD40 repeat protein